MCGALEYRLCNDKLRDIVFPHELAECGLANHRLVLDKLYKNIIQIHCEAASKSKEADHRAKRGRILCGWNKHVQEAHREARLRFQAWVLADRPTSGTIYNLMYASCKFKSNF